MIDPEILRERLPRLEELASATATEYVGVITERVRQEIKDALKVDELDTRDYNDWVDLYEPAFLRAFFRDLGDQLHASGLGWHELFVEAAKKALAGPTIAREMPNG